jgi:choline monooxygenase
MPRFFVDPDISKACTLDTSFYTSASYFDEAKERIFAGSWQFIGDKDDLFANGVNACPFTLLEHYLDEPLVLTKDQDVVHCLSNVCTHRGNVVVNTPCFQPHLRCGYHGRIFAIDGRFISMPEFKEVQNFPCETDNLAQLRLHQWKHLLFTSVSPKLNAEAFLGDMMERLLWFPVERLRFDASSSKDYHVKAHWALYCENYLEGFHIPFVHGGLNQVLDFGSYTTELFELSNLQVGVGKKGDHCFDLPVSSQDHGRDIAAYYFWIFPNMMFNFYPWGLSVNIVEPTTVSSCRVRFLTYILDETKVGQGAGAGLDIVELEDEEVVENVQRGIRSRFYGHGRYSVSREQGIHHFHSLISRHMNV